MMSLKLGVTVAAVLVASAVGSEGALLIRPDGVIGWRARARHFDSAHARERNLRIAVAEHVGAFMPRGGAPHRQSQPTSGPILTFASLCGRLSCER